MAAISRYRPTRAQSTTGGPPALHAERIVRRSQVAGWFMGPVLRSEYKRGKVRLRS